MRILLAAILVLFFTPALNATDLIRSGGGAGNEGVAGVLGLSSDALSGINGNPALLRGLEDGQVLSLSILTVDSVFTSGNGEVSKADEGPGLMPQFALKRQVSDDNWSWGAGFSVQSAMQADFSFVDPAGTLGVSYGRQTHRSEFLIAKASGALSYQVTPELAVGISLEAHYNRNQLQAPYIFQSHPVLAGLKVLVDLDADDLQLGTSVGLVFTPQGDWSFNLAWSPEIDFSADGDISGNLAQLGLGIQETFNYKARVETGKPEKLILGASWQVADRVLLGLQYDRIQWSSVFRDLPIMLTEGSNGDLNAFLGENLITDVAPLNWRNQDTWHFGLQYLLPSGTLLRFGYEDSEVPVPSATITPMTAATLDRAITVGASIQLAGRDIDLAYRYSDSDRFNVGDSALLGGEYDNTSQTLNLHTVNLSIRF
ncbi:MAG: outer membrane protein transport protein [Proteobacteria bacterium]|nr:outer membrane protein transport protein [Pseudomonadota bacterium]MDA0928695.1 outer membrane protein transport protein [Pseudomonadota bacterium]